MPALDALVFDLRRSLGARCTAIVLTGSYSYGSPRASSDVDVVILADVPSSRRVVDAGEIRLDLIFVASGTLETRIADPNQFGLVEMIALGDVLYMSDHGRETLELVWSRFACGLPPASPDERQRMREAVDTRVRQARVEAADAATASFLIALAVQVICEAELRLRGIWRDRPSSYLGRVARVNPSLEASLRRALDDAATVPARLVAMAAGAACVVAALDEPLNVEAAAS
jgi:predicted nucleotidyltransferase